MTRLNMGARNAKAYEYDTDTAVDGATAPTRETSWADLERQVGDALLWATGPRANAGDGVDIGALKRLDTAVCAKNHRGATRAAFQVLTGRTHPTARDIVGGAAKSVIYVLTGRRAHTFEVSDR